MPGIFGLPEDLFASQRGLLRGVVSSFVRSLVGLVNLYRSCHVPCRYCVHGLYFWEGPVFRTPIILDVLVEFLVFLGIVM
jgi:hypothetical protein